MNITNNDTAKDHIHCEWLSDRIESLLGEHKDSRIYKFITDQLDKISMEEKEKIIYETRIRMRTLLDYTVDVFGVECAGSKTYQMPHRLYDAAVMLFKERHPAAAAVVSEALMSVGGWEYRQFSNLLRFVCFDGEEKFLGNIVVFFMVLDEKYSMQAIAGKGNETYAQFFSEAVDEICRIDLDKGRDMLRIIRSSNPLEDYRQMVDNMLWRAYEYRVPEEWKDNYKGYAYRRNWYFGEKLNPDVVEYLREDMEDYNKHGYQADYNPLWIWGSKGYLNMLDYIMECKMPIEYKTLHTIHLSNMKAGQNGQDLSLGKRQAAQEKLYGRGIKDAHG